MDNMNKVPACDAFHVEFDRLSCDILERAREALLEGPGEVTADTLVAQILMDWLDRTELVNRRQAFNAAEHMGPDWTQALYHTAVFMTKVA